jgi:hypothetical protein
MPKTVDVMFFGITCDSNSFGGSVLLSGEVFAETFLKSFSDPPDSKESIFPFPAGPISISEGETVQIHLEHSTRFTVATTQDPPQISKLGRWGGTLNLGLGSSFATIAPGQTFAFPPDRSLVPVKFENANLAVTLHFSVSNQSF